MNAIRFLYSLIILVLFSQRIEGVEIALTFDDFPMGSSSLFKKKQRVEIYADKLARLNIQAAFFCIGEQIDSREGEECLALISPEHILANHSYHHHHCSKSALETFEEEVQQTEALLSPYENFRKWFRFPYLDYGDRTPLGGSDRKKTAIFLSLRERGYQHGYNTIHTLDWYVNAQLLKAIKEEKEVHLDRLSSAYMHLLGEWIDAYQQRWSRILKKRFVHILLLHQNDLNALFLNDIVALLGQKEWEIVPAERAYDSALPFPSKFGSTKVSLFKKVHSLSTDYVDQVLSEHRVFGL
jgi:peptidoglycan-N-acetylglucosamine deacetylase